MKSIPINKYLLSPLQSPAPRRRVPRSFPLPVLSSGLPPLRRRSAPGHLPSFFENDCRDGASGGNANLAFFFHAHPFLPKSQAGRADFDELAKYHAGTGRINLQFACLTAEPRSDIMRVVKARASLSDSLGDALSPFSEEKSKANGIWIKRQRRLLCSHERSLCLYSF